MPFSTRRKVGYFYDSDVGNFYYAQNHPMKPHRMRMTHNLLLAYGLFDKMDILTSPRATERDMTRFHADEYINFLRLVTPDTMNDNLTALSRFNILEDCPVFDGLWAYCQIAAGGSLAGAARLNSGHSSTVINWAGGLHHAKRAEASGFCYINDCVLAILELLKMHARVLYVDIDIHHGDGVEEAFYTTDRVMTVSFHKFGDYFPGTGDVVDVGSSRGKNYSVNFPLKDGITDDSYREIFVPVMRKVMQVFEPGAVVLQCGADSLSGDRLGCFNLSLMGHAQCVDFFGEYDVPLLLLGGGGYTIRNVARCWAYETSRVLNADITDDLPFNENYEFYGPEFRLHIATSNMEDHNTPAFLEKTKSKIFEQLRQLTHVPSIPFHETPRTAPLGVHIIDEDSDNDDPDVRRRSRRAKHQNEYEGSDDDADDDQYLSCLPVARKKVRKSSFPRRSASRVQRTSTTLAANMRGCSAGSPTGGPFPTSTVQINPAGTMSAANGRSHMPTTVYGAPHHRRAGLLVQTRESGTAATSDERLEKRSPFFPMSADALNTNVDSSTGGHRTAQKDRHNRIPENPDRKRSRTDKSLWDTRDVSALTSKQATADVKTAKVKKEAKEARDATESKEGKDLNAAAEKTFPPKKQAAADPQPDKMDILEPLKSKRPANSGRASPDPSASLRGASPSPERAVMEDVAPAVRPPKEGKSKEVIVDVKDPPSVGSTEILASTSKRSPSDTTLETAEKAETIEKAGKAEKSERTEKAEKAKKSNVKSKEISPKKRSMHWEDKSAAPEVNSKSKGQDMALKEKEPSKPSESSKTPAKKDKSSDGDKMDVRPPVSEPREGSPKVSPKISVKESSKDAAKDSERESSKGIAKVSSKSSGKDVAKDSALDKTSAKKRGDDVPSGSTKLSRPRFADVRESKDGVKTKDASELKASKSKGEKAAPKAPEKPTKSPIKRPGSPPRSLPKSGQSKADRLPIVDKLKTSSKEKPLQSGRKIEGGEKSMSLNHLLSSSKGSGGKIEGLSGPLPSLSTHFRSRAIKDHTPARTELRGEDRNKVAPEKKKEPHGPSKSSSSPKESSRTDGGGSSRKGSVGEQP